MKHLKEKIKNCTGESLVEVLASILIGSLSMILLVSMIMASVRINEKAEKYDEKYYENLAGAERQEPADIYTPTGVDSDKVTIGVDKIGTTTITLQVTYYGGEGICSYAKKETVGP